MSFRGIILMARPMVIVAGVLAYLVGVALAHYRGYELGMGEVLLGSLVFILANSSGHYVDEYADRDTDALTRKTMFSGGSDVLPAGNVGPAVALIAGVLTALLSLTVSFILWIWFGLSDANMVVLVIALIGGWAYSLPPINLERRGWGEMDNALIGGLLMPLYGYTFIGGTIDLEALAMLTPLVLAVFLNLLGVHWPDRIADGSVGKMTLVVLLGARTRWLHATMVLALLACYALLYLGPYPPMLSILLIVVASVAVYASWEYGGELTTYLSTVHMGLVMATMIIVLWS